MCYARNVKYTSLNDIFLGCLWHGLRFCMRDRGVLTSPATLNVPRYDVRICNGQIEVKPISQ